MTSIARSPSRIYNELLIARLRANPPEAWEPLEHYQGFFNGRGSCHKFERAHRGGELVSDPLLRPWVSRRVWPSAGERPARWPRTAHSPAAVRGQRGLRLADRSGGVTLRVLSSSPASARCAIGPRPYRATLQISGEVRPHGEARPPTVAVPGRLRRPPGNAARSRGQPPRS